MNQLYGISKETFAHFLDNQPVQFVKPLLSDSISTRLKEVKLVSLELQDTGAIFRSGSGAMESLCIPYNQIRYMYIDMETNPNARTLVIVIP